MRAWLWYCRVCDEIAPEPIVKLPPIEAHTCGHYRTIIAAELFGMNAQEEEKLRAQAKALNGRNSRAPEDPRNAPDDGTAERDGSGAPRWLR